MRNKKAVSPPKGPPAAKLLALLKPYRGLVAMLVALTILGNSLNLVVPKLISNTIDAWTQGQFVLSLIVEQFLLVAILVFLLTYAQTVSANLRFGTRRQGFA